MTPGKPLKTVILKATFLAAFTLVHTPLSYAAVTFHTVVKTGDIAPGTGTAFTGFSLPVINDHGMTAFTATTSDTEGVWLRTPTQFDSVVLNGQTAPGTEPGTVFTDFTPTPIINNTGMITFTSDLAGSGIDHTNGRGLWAVSSGTINLIARAGQPAPETESDHVFIFSSSPDLNDAGRILFNGYIDTPGGSDMNYRALYSTDVSTISLLVKEGDQVPDAPLGQTFSRFFSFVFFHNANGEYVLSSTVEGTDVTPDNNRGIWLGNENTLSRIVQQGDPAPGQGGGVTFKDFGYFNHLNNVGQVAFFATLAGPNNSTDYSIWSGTTDSLQLVTQSGDMAPGYGPDVAFNNYFDLRINDNNHIVFSAAVTGQDVDASNNQGLWLNHGGNTQLIAREGDAATGMPEGYVFGFDRGVFFPKTFQNQSGQIVFSAWAHLPGQDLTNRNGVWVSDVTGQLELILSSGDTFDVNDDPLVSELKVISSIAIHNDFGGEQRPDLSFNDAGQLAFRLNFTDGTSGIFVANTRLPGDLNGDGFVGIDDLTTVLNNWNQNVSPGDTLAGDATGDGFVGIDDLNTILPNWNAGTPPGTSTSASNPTPNAPEPASLLIFTGLLGLLNRRV